MKALIIGDGVSLLILFGLLSSPHPTALFTWVTYAAWFGLTCQMYKHSHHAAYASAIAGFLMVYVSNRRHFALVRAGKRRLT